MSKWQDRLDQMKAMQDKIQIKKMDRVELSEEMQAQLKNDLIAMIKKHLDEKVLIPSESMKLYSEGYRSGILDALIMIQEYLNK